MNRSSASECFVYRDGEMRCDGVALSTIAAQVGTPTFVYSAAAIEASYRAIDRAMGSMPHMIAYAVKANDNLSILSLLGRLGCGADIVSGGELARALRAGIPPARIVFSGVGKQDHEIRAALEAKIRAVHVESAEEIEVVDSIARSLGVRAPIAFRVNPNVRVSTHAYIATGLRSTKFGIEEEVARGLLERIKKSDALELEGLSCHVGSQLPHPGPLEEGVRALGRFAVECRAQGLNPRRLDVGGGWPMTYGDEKTPFPSSDEFGDAIRSGLRRSGAHDLGLEIMTEPGRALVGDAGVLLTKVLFTKEQGNQRFVIVDAAMTELIRPALYHAYHAVMPVREPVAGTEMIRNVQVVGPVCETGDFLALDRELPRLVRGDLAVVRGAGAYGASMSSHYNARLRAAEVLVTGDKLATIRKRETLEDLWRNE